MTIDQMIEWAHDHGHDFEAFNLAANLYRDNPEYYDREGFRVLFSHAEAALNATAVA